MGSEGPQGYLLQEAGPLVPAQQGARSLPRGRYSGRSDAGCLYELTVKLLSEHEDVLAEFNSGQVAVPPDSDDAGWIEVNRGVCGACARGAGLVGTPPTGTREVWWRNPGLRNQDR